MNFLSHYAPFFCVRFGAGAGDLVPVVGRRSEVARGFRSVVRRGLGCGDFGCSARLGFAGVAPSVVAAVSFTVM
jgi:hypothetical protein